jgi:hypothetical protein
MITDYLNNLSELGSFLSSNLTFWVIVLLSALASWLGRAR